MICLLSELHKNAGDVRGMAIITGYRSQDSKKNTGLTCLRSAAGSAHHKPKRPVFTRTDQKHRQSALRGPQRNESEILRDEFQLGPFCALSSPLKGGPPSVWKVLVGGDGMSLTAVPQHNLDKTATCQP